MDYGRPELADRLAGEYVLGTLRGPARRRFESLLAAHPALRAAVADWRGRLVPLAVRVRAVEPSPQVWTQIERRLFGAPAAEPARLPWWRRVGMWQAAAVASLSLGVVLGMHLPQTGVEKPPVVVVLAANPQAGGASAIQASFVASVSADGRSLVLKPIQVGNVSADRTLELWAVPGQGAPHSLGVVSAQGATRVLRASVLSGTAALAVSLEPAGGSPTGAPTGPILSVGKLEL